MHVTHSPLCSCIIWGRQPVFLITEFPDSDSLLDCRNMDSHDQNTETQSDPKLYWSPSKPPPEIISNEDVLLRRWRLSDVEALQAAASQSIAELAPWMPWARAGYDRSNAENFLNFAHNSWEKNEEFNYAIIVDGEPSGSFGIMKPITKAPDTLEIGYWLRTNVTGRGLATGATRLLTAAAFDLGAKHVQIRHDEENVRSAGIPKKLDFTCLGVKEFEGEGNEKEVVKSVIWQKDYVSDQKS